MTDTRPCRKCGRPMVPQHGPIPPGAVVHSARGLCAGCYSWATYHGKLAEFPKLQRTAASVVEEREFLAAQGLRDDEIAQRLGMKRASMERALYRHRARERAA